MEHLKRHPEQMYQLRPRLFEELVGEVLASYGWEVHITPARRDGGYDLFCVSKDDAGVRTSWIIECKRYREDRPVGVEVARALYGVKGDLRVANAMLATTSRFTKGVHDFKASRHDFDLKDYEGILEWINHYKPNPNSRLYVKDNRLALPSDEGFEAS
ncbi:MAG: restriction endonuclease [Planctomycetota bacterium]